MSNHKKKIIFRFNFLFFSTQENKSSYRNDFNIIKYVFSIMHIAYYVKISISYSYFCWGKLTNKKINFKMGKGKGVFLQLFKCCITQWINELQAQYVFRNVANYHVYHKCKNIAVIKICNVLKHKKSRVHFLMTWNNLKLGSILKFNNWKMVNNKDMKVFRWVRLRHTYF